jgi:hypothetical protein
MLSLNNSIPYIAWPKKSPHFQSGSKGISFVNNSVLLVALVWLAPPLSAPKSLSSILRYHQSPSLAFLTPLRMPILPHSTTDTNKVVDPLLLTDLVDSTLRNRHLANLLRRSLPPT